MSDAAAGELPTYLIFQLLGYFTLSYLVLIAPFALYLAVVLSLGRLYKDNEITAAEACGIGIPRIMKSVFYLSLFMAVCVGVLSVWIAPWAEEQQYSLRDQAKMESEFGFIAAGRFHEIRRGQGVFYVESFSDDNRIMRNVFVQLQTGDKVDIFSANRGYLDVDKKTGASFIVLQDGYRYEELENNQGYRLHEYKSSGIRIEPESIAKGKRKVIATSTKDLMEIDTLEAKAELHWRIAMPISCILLTLIGVLISRTNPRQGRFGKLFIGLLVYILYIYILMLTKNWLKHGDIPMFVGMWWIHFLMLIYLFVLAGRQFGWQWMVAKITRKEMEAST